MPICLLGEDILWMPGGCHRPQQPRTLLIRIFSARNFVTSLTTVELRSIWRRPTHGGDKQPQQGYSHQDTPRVPTGTRPAARSRAKRRSCSIPIVHAAHTALSAVAATATLVHSCGRPTTRRGGGAKVSAIRLGKRSRYRESGGRWASRRGIPRRRG